jgi:hypothetical protein
MIIINFVSEPFLLRVKKKRKKKKEAWALVRGCAFTMGGGQNYCSEGV